MKKTVSVLSAFLVLLFAVESQGTLLLGLPADDAIGGPNPTPTPLFGTLIDFDTFATGTLLAPTDLLPWGVSSFTATNGGLRTYSGFQSAPNYVGAADGSWNGTFRFNFLAPSNQVMVGVANSRGGPEFIRTFDSGGGLIESYEVPAGLNVYVGIGRASYDIASFEIAGDFFAVDDLQFTGAVPEPGSLLLLASGLLSGGLGFIRRRRQG